MAETVKKTAKAAAKPRKTAAKKATATADPVAETHNESAAHHGHSNGHAVNHDEVAKLAHSYWQERGHDHGQHEDDWYRAEQELKGKRS